MKKILSILLFLAFLITNLNAQNSFSLGLGGSNLVRPDIPLPTFSSKNIGFIYQYDLSSRLALEY